MKLSTLHYSSLKLMATYKTNQPIAYLFGNYYNLLFSLL